MKHNDKDIVNEANSKIIKVKCLKCGKPYATKGFDYCYSCKIRIQLEDVTQQLADSNITVSKLRTNLILIEEENTKLVKDNEFLIKSNNAFKKHLNIPSPYTKQ